MTYSVKDLGYGLQARAGNLLFLPDSYSPDVLSQVERFLLDSGIQQENIVIPKAIQKKYGRA